MPAPEVARPFPSMVDPAYAEHVAALRDGALVVRRCVACARLQWPPRPTCAQCRGEAFEPCPVEAAGEVYTFTVVHRAFHPWFADRLPYAVALVDLDHGLRLTGLYDGDVAGLRCDLPVVGRGEVLGGAPALVWRPAETR